MKIKTNSILLATVATLSMAITSGASAAVFAKYDGVDGESTNTSTQTIKVKNVSPQPVGMLLPAVQAAREAARRSSTKSKGKVDATWVIEKGEK